MKKAIIVGATSGIGRNLAKLLINDSYQVGITGRRANLLEDIKSENPDNYKTKAFDITDLKNIPEYLVQLTHELDGRNARKLCVSRWKAAGKVGP